MRISGGSSDGCSSDLVQPGAPCESGDAAARRVRERAGLGPDYRLPGLPHRTGHGIGLSIHEPSYLVRGDKTPLAPGMCFSNEPMIVMPDRFGIRLEDHFHVTEEGAAWFTHPSPSIDAPFGRSEEQTSELKSLMRRSYAVFCLKKKKTPK